MVILGVKRPLLIHSGVLLMTGIQLHRLTEKQQSKRMQQLDLMLGQIANYCPVISRNSIIKTSTSLRELWQTIRQHYGFQSSGAHFLDYVNIHLEADERPEDLYQRLMAFFEDNLLTSAGLSHHGAALDADEDMSPTLENTVILLWLQMVNPGLPQLVKQRYGAELRNKTLASLKPEISQALSSLLDELRSIEDAKVMRSYTRPTPTKTARKPFKSCVLCKSAHRQHNTHNLIDCKFLPD